MSDQQQCGYCHARIDDWDRTPRGRPVCPDCGSIPHDYQREHDGMALTAIDHLKEQGVRA